MKRPPVWLAAAAVASAWAEIYTIGRWTSLYAAGPVHEDVVMYYVAAETGLRHGWAAIYDQHAFRSMSQFPIVAHVLDLHRPYASSPVMAWLFAPLTLLPEPLAYGLWSALSLGTLVVTWLVIAPYRGLVRITLLLVAIGLWPFLLTLYFGQPTPIVLAGVAAAWWLCTHERPLAAGAVLALAAFLKPQAVLLLPAALLVAGQYRAVASTAVTGAALGALCVATIGVSGLNAWWSALVEVRGLPVDIEYTLQHYLGAGPLTYALWAVQGVAALITAYRRRDQLEIVFCAGLLGTVATASYIHEADFIVLVPAAWFFLRTGPPLWQRVWLLAGLVSMQLMTLGPASTNPAWDLATHVPQLVFDAAWLGVLTAAAWADRSPAVGKVQMVKVRAR